MQSMLVSEFETIEKEEISKLKFPESEVLANPQQIGERSANLNSALSLGNLEHSKIKIFFEDDNCRRVVETTVWGVTDKRVILKQGVGIPISRIHSVKL